jgi:Signal transduction histidine kinase
LANLFLENQFRKYIKDNMGRQSKQVVSLLSEQYHWDGTWNYGGITEISMNALEQGLIVKLDNADGKTVWDITTHNSGLCQQMIVHMARNMASRYHNFNGRYVINRFPVLKNFKKVGTVEIGFYGPFYYNDSDLAFINTLNRIFMGVTVLAIFIALLIGYYMAKRLSTPISRVIDTAGAIADGRLESRSYERTNVKEISQLTTTINNLAETLQQQELLRKRLTADVAHELRTPLATVQSHLEAMIDGVWKLEIPRLKSCHEEITRISRLVADLGKLAKYESENLSLHKTKFDLAELIRQVILNFESEFHHQGITVECFRENEWFIEADHDKIGQVMVNLINNSLKYTPVGGTITINISNRPPDMTEISVKDTGIGVSSTDLPHIFERFYRADKSRNRLSGGSGIGLAIVKVIVEAHKGTVKVQSEPGKGTEFIVSLPL